MVNLDEIVNEIAALLTAQEERRPQTNPRLYPHGIRTWRQTVNKVQAYFAIYLNTDEGWIVTADYNNGGDALLATGLTRRTAREVIENIAHSNLLGDWDSDDEGDRITVYKA